jgi:crotonobetainyl-CoA:carnitine CoA-transferase CaiB-like acyl-CoA transferase
LADPGDEMAIERKLTPIHESPYRGLRVLDFEQGITSPYCAMVLGRGR